MSEFFLKFDFKGEFTNDILDSDCQNFLSVVLVLLGWTLIVCRWKLKLTCREKCEKDPNKRKETETFEGPSDFSEKHYSLLVSLPPTNNRVLLWVQQRFWWCQLGLCLSGPAEVDLVERTLVWTHSCWVVWFCRNINSSFTRHKHLTTLKTGRLSQRQYGGLWLVRSFSPFVHFIQPTEQRNQKDKPLKKEERENTSAVAANESHPLQPRPHWLRPLPPWCQKQQRDVVWWERPTSPKIIFTWILSLMHSRTKPIIRLIISLSAALNHFLLHCFMKSLFLFFNRVCFSCLLHLHCFYPWFQI